MLWFVSFAALLTVPLLSIGRFLDNNALTSWNWIFPTADIGQVYLFIVLGTILSFFLSRTSILERYPGLVLPVLAFLAVVPLWREPEVILDASRYFLQAKHLELYGISSFFREWGRDIGVWTDLPVVPFFYGLIFRYIGESRLYIQVFTSLLFSLTLLLTYGIGRHLWNRDMGIAAGMLLLGIPYLLTQVPLMLVDVPTMFLVTLFVFVYLRALEKGGWLWMALASLSLFLSLLSKYSVGPVLLVVPLIIAVLVKSDPRRILWRSTGVIAGAGVLSAALLYAQYDVVMNQLHLLRTYQLPGLARWQEGLASTFLFQTHPFITLAACFSVVAAVRKRDVRFLVPGWFALFVVFIQHERIRYLLPILPLFTLMAAYGLQEVRDREVRQYIVWCVVSTSLVITLTAYAPFLDRLSMVNLRDAGGYLDTLEGGAVDVYILPQTRSPGNTEMAIPLLDLYTRKKIVYRDQRSALSDTRAIALSSLRFSWEIRQPAFYADEGTDACLPVVLISGVPSGSPPADSNRHTPLHLLRGFYSSSSIFKYKTFVTVFTRDCMSETAQ